MNLTAYSLIMAVIWFDIFVLLGSLLQRKLHLFLNYNFYPIVLLIVLSLIRLFAPVETPFTTVIQSWVIAPAIQKALKAEIALGGSLAVPAFEAIVFVASAIAVVLLIKMLRTYRRGFMVVNGYPKTDDKRLLGIMGTIVQKDKPYRLCVLDGNISPAICGLWKPTIILPASIFSMTDEDIRYILIHEWRHFTEKDLWIKLFINIICCVMWWNPVVYLLKMDIDQTLELKCDTKTTLQLGAGDRLNYLSTLLKVARMQHAPEEERSAAIHFTGRSGVAGANTKQRFQAVLARGPKNKLVEVLSVACLLSLFLVSFAFVVQPCFPPPMDGLEESANPSKDLVGFVSATSDNAYIVEEGGAYLLYIDNQYARTLLPEELQDETHKKLPIIANKK